MVNHNAVIQDINYKELWDEVLQNVQNITEEYEYVSRTDIVSFLLEAKSNFNILVPTVPHQQEDIRYKLMWDSLLIWLEDHPDPKEIDSEDIFEKMINLAE